MKTTSRSIRALALAAVTVGVTPGSVLSQSQADHREFKTDFAKHTVPFDEIVSGGPPKDGIPALDRPKFEDVRRADSWLKDREPVVIVTAGGVAKAYPLQILIWHEIVNDVVGGTPVTITFCPLCNTALSFDRRFDGKLLDFGTTGRLRHSDLVMYDRQTETWWQQATGEGIVGQYAGRQLTFVASPLINWKTFKDRYPDGQVLSRDTGFRRDYGHNPYVGYDREKSPIRSFFFGRPDARLPAMERVVAVDFNNVSVAVPFSVLQEKRVVAEEVGGMPIVVFWAPGTASALDNESIPQGRDVGSSGVFDPRIGGRSLRFTPDGDGQFTDEATGSTWDILGRATDGSLAGEQLAEIPHGNHFWFAWGVFKPDTRIVN